MIFLEDKYKKSLQNFTFIDLFAGIGGFRIALESMGANCVFSSEIDKFAREVYKNNFGDLPSGDIRLINENDIPNHDILCAGFPCQAFSISGKQKGFSDSRGALFFDMIRIVKAKQPKMLFLENVKNLVNHNNKKTFKFIIKTLEDLNYKVFYKVINSCDFGLAQSRNRVYIIALHKEKLKNCEFIFPTGFNSKIVVKDILENHNIDKYIIDSKEFTIDVNKVNKSMIHKNSFRVGTFKNGGQGERIYSIYGKAITLSAEGGGIAAKTGAYYVNGNIRKLSPIECARLQGFPTTFKIIHSDNQAWKQFGNSVSINVLQCILMAIVDNNNLMVLYRHPNTANKIALVQKGSEIAKSGFKNENILISKINNWQTDKNAQKWLKIMGYNLNNLETVVATKVKGSFKADIQIEIKEYSRSQVELQNISVKLISNKKGFNQIDKRYVDKYQKLWNIPDDIALILKKFVGEVKPDYLISSRDGRRLFFNEMSLEDRQKIINFFLLKKSQIGNDLLKGRNDFIAHWMLVVKKMIILDQELISWSLHSIEKVINYFFEGEVSISKRGSLNIGKITMQRKGGDGGRQTANMLQFKMDPSKLFDF